MKISCAVCHHSNLSGALFCSECGSQLVEPARIDTRSIQKTPSDFFSSDITLDPIGLEINNYDNSTRSSFMLRIIDTNEIIDVKDKTVITIGRTVDSQADTPDVDLSPYDAYQLGVSRVHLKVALENGRALLTDLASSNGTRINGQKILPNVSYPIHLGDTISLGKLKLQILSHP